MVSRKVNVGDKVLFIDTVLQSVRWYKGYTVGTVKSVSQPNNVVTIVDHCGKEHVVFERFVHSLEKR